ncbi:hypothetical protein BC628DRAFT_1086431 [Trametes gibbosa]|nr:hypothetical protein BC628DRAFT_1086431 [Trametes gibbosa]
MRSSLSAAGFAVAVVLVVDVARSSKIRGSGGREECTGQVAQRAGMIMGAGGRRDHWRRRQRRDWIRVLSSIGHSFSGVCLRTGAHAIFARVLPNLSFLPTSCSAESDNDNDNDSLLAGCLALPAVLVLVGDALNGDGSI